MNPKVSVVIAILAALESLCVIVVQWPEVVEQVTRFRQSRKESHQLSINQGVLQRPSKIPIELPQRETVEPEFDLAVEPAVDGVVNPAEAVLPLPESIKKKRMPVKVLVGIFVFFLFVAMLPKLYLYVFDSLEGQVQVNAEHLIVRKDSSRDSAEVARIKDGRILHFYQYDYADISDSQCPSNVWLKIISFRDSYNNGWVCLNYVDLAGDYRSLAASK